MPLAEVVTIAASGVLVGGFIILTNIQTLLQVWFINNLWDVLINSCIVIGWMAAILFVIRKNKG